VSEFFVRRPIVAIVISILTVLLGLVSVAQLPIAQFPDIAPPAIQLATTYVGADAITAEQAVATPIEQEMNGVDDSIYFYSVNTNAGNMTLYVNFEVGTDPNIDQVLSQMRYTQAESKLPEDVRNYGITVKKSTTSPLALFSLYSPNGTSDAEFLANYAILLKNDGRIPDALTAIDQALRQNPESWNLQVLKAGYLCLSGRMDEGKALFATVKPPRADAEFWANMQAWFCAVSDQREEFYRLFAAALASAHSERVLNWIEQDVDLDRYRGEPEFRRLLDEHRPRLLGEKP
jgi:tetratricopeptide (TPR) repeat protein